MIATNLGNVTLAGNSFLGPVINSCTSASLGTYTQSDGTGGRLDSVSLSGCTNNRGGTTTITASGLPYTGGHVDYAPVAAWPAGQDRHRRAERGRRHQGRPRPPGLGPDGRRVPLRPDDDVTAEHRRLQPVQRQQARSVELARAGQAGYQSLQFISGASICPASASANGNFQIVTDPGGANLDLGP